MDKEKLAELAKDCHIKQMRAEELHKRLQKEKTPDLAAEYAIAQVEHRRAKKILDNEMADQSVIIVTPQNQGREVISSGFCEHNPAQPNSTRDR